MFDSFVFLPLSTRAYFKGRAYIKIILKNHARFYFAGRSYYRGNTVALTDSQIGVVKCLSGGLFEGAYKQFVALGWERTRGGPIREFKV